MWTAFTPSGGAYAASGSGCVDWSASAHSGAEGGEGAGEGVLHISLSRCFPMRLHLVAPFIEHLRQALRGAPVPRFHVAGSGAVDVLVNDEGTRSFLCAVVGAGRAEVLRLIGHTDATARAFGLPTYWSNPQPHVSLAWALGDVRAQCAVPTEVTLGAVEHAGLDSAVGLARAGAAADTAASTAADASGEDGGGDTAEGATTPLTSASEDSDTADCLFRVTCSRVVVRCGNETHAIELGSSC